MYNEAIVLAGGMGTRLQEVVPDKPKPMALINGKPFLEYLINYMKKQHIQKVILSVGFKAEQIKNYFGNKFHGIQIEYALEKKPLGTGGGILLSMEKVEGKKVFILNGDTFFNISLQELAQKGINIGADLTIALRKVDDASRYGTIKTDNHNKITGFAEKQEMQGSALINGGTYFADKDWFLNRNLPEKFSFEKEVLEKFYSNENFYGFPFNDYFIDIGIPATYKQAQTDFLNEFSK